LRLQGKPIPPTAHETHALVNEFENVQGLPYPASLVAMPDSDLYSSVMIYWRHIQILALLTCLMLAAVPLSASAQPRRLPRIWGYQYAFLSGSYLFNESVEGQTADAEYYGEGTLTGPHYSSSQDRIALAILYHGQPSWAPKAVGVGYVQFDVTETWKESLTTGIGAEQVTHTCQGSLRYDNYDYLRLQLELAVTVSERQRLVFVHYNPWVALELRSHEECRWGAEVILADTEQNVFPLATFQRARFTIRLRGKARVERPEVPFTSMRDWSIRLRFARSRVVGTPPRRS
jgi:hypothetical protein